MAQVSPSPPFGAFMCPTVELTPSQSEKLNKCIEPVLSNPDDVEGARRAIEDAISDYLGFIDAGGNNRTRDRSESREDLARIGGLAESLVQELKGLHPETTERLEEWVRYAGSPDGEVEPTYSPIVPPETLNRVRRDLIALVAGAHIATKRLDHEESRNGRPRDRAAWLLVERCASVFEHYSASSLSGKGSRHGPFERIVATVFEITGADGNPSYYAREFLKRRGKKTTA